MGIKMKTYKKNKKRRTLRKNIIGRRRQRTVVINKIEKKERGGVQYLINNMYIK
jgi:hypothetical protein